MVLPTRLPSVELVYYCTELFSVVTEVFYKGVKYNVLSLILGIKKDAIVTSCFSVLVELAGIEPASKKPTSSVLHA